MNKTIVTILLFANAAVAQTTKWGFDASHAKVGFSVSHFGISETEGKFTKFDGLVLSDKADFSDAKINFTIDVNSINTEDSKRDEHLKSADFFDVAKYPSILFTGKSLKSTGKNMYRLTGSMTMHGVTKDIVLDVLYRGTVPKDPYGNTKAGFKITGIIDRTQYGLTWNGKLAGGELLVGDNVHLDIDIELIKK